MLLFHPQIFYGMVPFPRLHSGPLDPNISSVSSELCDLVNGDCQCPFLQLPKSLPSQYVPLPLLVFLVLLETQSPP